MVTTNDLALAQKVDILRNHGASISEEKRHLSNKPYILPDFDVCGFNYRMTDIQASIGIVRQKLSLLAFRQKWATYYTNELDSISWITSPVIPNGYYHGWQSYVCMIDETISPYPRNKVMEILQEKELVHDLELMPFICLGIIKTSMVIKIPTFLMQWRLTNALLRFLYIIK